MKKLIIVLLIWVACMVQSDEILHYEFYMNEGEKKCQIKYNDDVKQLILYWSDYMHAYGIVLDEDTKETLTKWIDKISEWKTVAVQNGVKALKKEMDGIYIAGFFRSYGNEWHISEIIEMSSLFVVATDQLQIYYIFAICFSEMVANSNEYITVTPEKLLLSVDESGLTELQELKKALTQEAINETIKKNLQQKEVAELFK